MTVQTSSIRAFASRAGTIVLLFRHFTDRRRIFMLPILLLIMLSAILLLVAGGLSYVAPFVYAVF